MILPLRIKGYDAQSTSHPSNPSITAMPIDYKDFYAYFIPSLDIPSAKRALRLFFLITSSFFQLQRQGHCCIPLVGASQTIILIFFDEYRIDTTTNFRNAATGGPAAAGNCPCCGGIRSEKFHSSRSRARVCRKLQQASQSDTRGRRDGS